MTEYLEILHRSPLFRGIEAGELSALLDCMGARPRQIKKGDTVLAAGERATHLGIVLAGRGAGQPPEGGRAADRHG